jgi:hypothetical protein
MNCERSHDEEMLTRELRALADEMNELSAPESVEQTVLEAFRARKVVPIARKRPNSRYWLAAVAAVLLIAMSVVALRWRSEVEAPRQTVAGKQSPKQPEVSQPREVLPAPVQFQAVNEPPKRNERKPVRQPRSRRPANAQMANHATEIATDFIPLRYMNAANLQDGGQIIRLELPRSALVKFGLPVNMDRYNEKVKADVLFGVDGLAQAIRFVQ